MSNLQPAAEQNATIDAPGRSLTTNVDGAVSVDRYLRHHTRYNPPTETIESVHGAANTFGAEQGPAGGVAFIVNSKSGINDLYGAIFTYHSNIRVRSSKARTRRTYSVFPASSSAQSSATNSSTSAAGNALASATMHPTFTRLPPPKCDPATSGRAPPSSTTPRQTSPPAAKAPSPEECMPLSRFSI